MKSLGMDALFDFTQTIDIDSLQYFKNPSTFKQYIQENLAARHQEINNSFWENHSISAILVNRARLADRAIRLIWHWHNMSQFHDVAIIATGGYGDQHLHPHSDIDTLIIVPNHTTQALNQQIETMISFLWDVGFNFSTSVLTLAENKTLAKSDVSMFTSLLSSRHIVGSEKVSAEIKNLPYTDSDLWPFKEFYYAKLKERQDRHQRFANSENNQEPNIKESPGALRDIDFIVWLAKRRYGNNALLSLCKNHNFTEFELELLNKTKLAFWEIRYALHLLTPKPNDRLYLEYQADIAKSLDWPGQTLNESVADMMQQYFSMAAQIKAISDILAQRFQERLNPAKAETRHVLSAHCQLVGNFLDITQMEWFTQQPEEFISLFLIHANTYAIEGFTAKTNQALYVYFNRQPKGKLLNNPIAREYFVELFQFPHKVGDTLSLMNRLGVLSQFVPAFSDLIGQMQFDLNHIYTTDAHTLRVIQFVQAFYLETNKNDLPFVADCLKICDDPFILYCAAFFHDIGKGRGGDHSQIGQEIALTFCQTFKLSTKRTELITWLVFHHLALSRFAQSKDLTDENMIFEFATFAESKEKLCYLYLLTAADIQGTNPKLWNSWRRALLRDLFNKTLTLLNQTSKPTKPSKTSTRKRKVIQSLLKDNINETDVFAFWENLEADYFEMTNSQSLKWHAVEFLKHPPNSPLIAIRPHWNKAGTDVFIYAHDSYGLFASICQTLEKLRLTIADAKISTTKSGYGLYGLIILESSGQPITGPQRLMEIKTALFRLLHSVSEQDDSLLKLPYFSRRVPRWYKHYQTNAKVEIYSSPDLQYTIIEVHAPDFPGLLARIGQILVKHNLSIHSAKINTLADKVIDFFYVTNKKNHMPLDSEKTKQALRREIILALR